MCSLDILIAIVSIAMIVVSLSLLIPLEKYKAPNPFKGRVISMGYGYPIKNLNDPAQLIRIGQVIQNGQFDERTIGDIKRGTANLSRISNLM